MPAMMNNGSYVPDGRGGFRQAEGTEGLLQEALFRLTCRRGQFPLLPQLGSRLYLLPREKASARDMAARQYAQEALEGLGISVTAAHVEEAADGASLVRLELTAEDAEISLEVRV